MSKNLPQRPNLDHLRRQAKALLSAWRSGDAEAIATFKEHLPTAKRMTKAQVQQGGFRLADAQSAIARKTGFDGWPQLARHVELLRAMEGTWEFASLEVGGATMPAAAMVQSRILIDGDCFRTESPEATYEGVFNIDVEAEPHRLDIEFVAGPEAGNWNYGIFRLDGDRLEICLDMSGKSRPEAFRTQPGTMQALETLSRASKDRPTAVSGGVAPERAASVKPDPDVGFAYVPSRTLDQLQGEWAAVQVVRDGQALPAMMCKSGVRSASKNEIKISFGGTVMIHALVRVDESTSPISVDYYNIGGMGAGTTQHGIMRWNSDRACFCMAAPCDARPTDFDCPKGSGRTLSEWRRKA